MLSALVTCLDRQIPSPEVKPSATFTVWLQQIRGEWTRRGCCSVAGLSPMGHASGLLPIRQHSCGCSCLTWSCLGASWCSRAPGAAWHWDLSFTVDSELQRWCWASEFSCLQTLWEKRDTFLTFEVWKIFEVECFTSLMHVCVKEVKVGILVKKQVEFVCLFVFLTGTLKRF